MSAPLHVLIIDDVEDDTLLIVGELKRGGYDPIVYERVETPEAMKAALENEKWDIILSDYGMPHFSGHDVLVILREKGLDMPFIIVTGTISDEQAVAAVKAGANDYVLKNNLTRLPAAVGRELRGIEVQRALKQVEEKFRIIETRFRIIKESANDAVICLEALGIVNVWNKKAEEMFGYSESEAVGKDVHTLIAPERYREKAYEGLQVFFQTGKGPLVGKTAELLALRKDGTEFPVEISLSAMNIMGEWHSAAIIRDITLRKQAEEKIKSEMELTAHLLMVEETTAHTTDIDKLMEKVIHCICKILGCDVCLSYLWKEETGRFQASQCCGLSHSQLPLFRSQSLDERVELLGKAFEVKKPLVETQNIESLQWIPDINTVVAIPLAGRQKKLGLILNIYKSPWKPAKRDEKILEYISHQVSTTLEDASLYNASVNEAMELSHKIEIMEVMHEIDKSILSTLDSQDIIETATMMIFKVISCDSTAVILVDEERQGFTYASGFGISFAAKGSFIPFENTNATEVVKTGRPQYVANLNTFGDILPFEKALIHDGYLSYIMVSLVVKGEVKGVLYVGSKRTAAFDPKDLSTLEKLVYLIGVALENARLITDMEELFMGMVKALSSAIEAKSRWTAGHSDRVTKYALQIGIRMGLSEKELENLQLAGLLHDIGKIGTFEYVLDKAENLTEDETKIIRQHTIKGAEILASVKQLREVVPAVKYHQEFYDGNGYPEGLKGEAIPLLARIIGVADAIDAMGADRPYRNGKPMSSIVAELKKCSGTQFDPAVVEAFLKVMSEVI